jgi:3-deoxy-manno-octulosonate cytidylyltransferase (CMP-KDO synthetase)
MALVVIPARFGSTRFPGKPLALLGGRPLIEHVYRRAERANGVEEVIVATDDERIVRAVEGFGGKGVLTDPGHRSGSDRVGEVARGVESDVVVNVQGDEPFLDSAVIEEVIRPFREEDPPHLATAARPLESEEEYMDPGTVKVVVNRKGDALYFSRSPIPHGWSPTEGSALGHIGIYAFSRDSLLRFVSLPRGELEQREDLEQLRALENGMRIAVARVDGFRGIGIDRPEDLVRAQKMLLETGNGKGDGNGFMIGEEQ